MAKVMVKCLYCGQSFDRNSEPFVKPRTNRYAHTSCHEQHEANKTQEERDYEALVEYIKQLLGSNPSPRVWKQLKEYVDVYQYTYSGILKTLRWWYEVRHNDVDQANGGIGIVPYVYDQACKYYYALYLAAIANQDKDVQGYTDQIREFTIETPRAQKRPPRLFKFREEE